MWLLSTDRAELHYFTSPESVPGGYAILSHVWDQTKEQSFQDIRTLEFECRSDLRNPRDSVSDKIRGCCELAARQGYSWVWIDTCCIDKASSAELSEAINSMYHYYSLAEVCFAYLADVPNSTEVRLEAKRSAFRTSRWHTRGWTLQELIAPPFLVLVSQTWDPLGTKADLAHLLEEITGIPSSVLRYEKRVSDASIAQRMFWYGTRKTTRIEDEAYCLLGIFGINMPTLYGEGSRAFQRLQEEIMRQSTDTSLFAWGSRVEYLHHQFQISRSHREHNENSYFFASSPSCYLTCEAITCTLGSQTWYEAGNGSLLAVSELVLLRIAYSNVQ